MQAQLALLLCLGFIGWLFVRDSRLPRGRQDRGVSWIPAIWFANINSKPVSYWLGIGGGTTSLEGNPVEAAVHLAIFAAAFLVLIRRRVDWGSFVKDNKIVLLLFGYLSLSVLWSEFPGPSLKRIFKEFGQLLVLLVLFTEKDPMSAVKQTFCRGGFLLLPLSLVLIRYFGDMGRVYHHYSGGVMFVGVADQKNGLGALTLLCSLGLIWQIVAGRRSSVRLQSWWDMRHLLVSLWLGVYLLLLSNSKTSLVCFAIALLLYWAGTRSVVQKNRALFLTGFCVAVPCLFLLEEFFRISDAALAVLGRDRTLTERTDLWDAILQTDMNNIIGWGFYSFWETAAGRHVTSETGLGVAHNGYLELFLDGGILGLCLLAVMIVSALVKTGREVIWSGNDSAVMKFAFVVMALAYNYAESAFFRPSVVWFCFLFAALRAPALEWHSVPSVNTDGISGPNFSEISAAARNA